MTLRHWTRERRAHGPPALGLARAQLRRAAVPWAGWPWRPERPARRDWTARRPVLWRGGRPTRLAPWPAWASPAWSWSVWPGSVLGPPGARSAARATARRLCRRVRPAGLRAARPWAYWAPAARWHSEAARPGRAWSRPTRRASG